MSDRQIFRAFNKHLKEFTYPEDTFRVAWRPKKFKAVYGETWLRPKYFPAGDIPITCNPIQTRSQRIFEIDCFVSEKKGEDAAWGLADAVSNHFFPPNGETNFLFADPQQVLTVPSLPACGQAACDIEDAVPGGEVFQFTVQINRKPEKSPLLPEDGFEGVAVLVPGLALL